MLRDDVRTVETNGLHYLLDDQGRPRRRTPWLADRLAFLYDWVMRTSVLPKKLAADAEGHEAEIRRRLADTHGLDVLELGTGTGCVAPLLPPDNRYRGVDVSAGLLRRAVRAFERAGFRDAELYVAGAEDVPFADDTFDLCLCHLSLYFFADIDAVLGEVERTLRPGSRMLVSVPVPERNRRGSTINGTVRSEGEIRDAAQRRGFSMTTLPVDNGAILYAELTAGSPGTLGASG